MQGTKNFHMLSINVWTQHKGCSNTILHNDNVNSKGHQLQRVSSSYRKQFKKVQALLEKRKMNLPSRTGVIHSPSSTQLRLNHVSQSVPK